MNSQPPKSQLNPTEVQKVFVQRATLQRGENLVKVPWQALAAIWYRESFSTDSPAVAGGPFQFDPVPAPSQLQTMLQRYVEILTANQIQELVNQGVEEFASACIFAACHLRDVCRYDLAVDKSDDAIKDAFYGYNGRAYGSSPNDSPYVMNNFDSAHSNMHIIGTLPANGGRIHVDTIDLRPGAFTVYKQLLGIAQLDR